MAALTIVAIQARKAIKYGIVAFFVIVIGRLILIFAINAFRQAFPAPPPPATVKFQRLAEIPFPDYSIELPELEFVIDTPTGGLPTVPEQLPVYLMPQKTANLFSFDRMTQRASSYGFNGEPVQNSDTVYEFRHSEVPATFKTNIVYESFSISFNLAEDTSPLNSRAPDVQTATKSVTQSLTRANSMPEDLAGPITSEFLRVEGQNLVRALALSDAQLTKINMYRSPIVFNEVEYPSVTADPKEGNVWFIVSGTSDRAKTIIAGEYHYFGIDYDQISTYPTKTAEEAVEELKNGEAYIANLGLNTSGQITIRNIYLAYYDPNVPYSFYQPVIVLEGDREFVAYVPAVSDEYYGEASGENSGQ
jgi:hypothetical protein